MRWIVVSFMLWMGSAYGQDSGLLTAEGFGTADLKTVTVKSQAKMMARRAATWTRNATLLSRYAVFA